MESNRKHCILPILAVSIIAGACTKGPVEESPRDPASYAVSSTASSSHVTAFGEDASGHIWIGTQGGLNRYNGKEFYQYFRVEEPYALGNDYIQGFLTDSRGRFWVINNSGACFYNDRDAFTRTDMDVTLRAATSMTETTSGDIVLYSMAGELLYLDESDLTFRSVSFSTPVPTFSSIHAMPGGTVLMVSNDALYEVDYHSGTVLQTIPWPDDYPSLSKRAVHDGRGHLFAYGRKYLVCFDLHTEDYVPLPDWMSPLKDKMVSLLYFKEDRAFAVTEDGLWYYDGKARRLYHPEENGPYALSDFLPTTLFLDSRDILWAGSSSRGFIQLSETGNLFNRNRILERSLRDLPTSALTLDGNGGMWLISEGALYHWSPPGTLQEVSPLGDGETFQDVAFNATDGTVWVARHWDAFSFRYENGRITGMKQYSMPRRINRLLCCPDGTVCAGTYYKGIFRIDPASDRISTIREPASDINYGQAGSIYDLCLLRSGELAATIFQEDIEIFDLISGRRRVLPYRDQIRELFNLVCLMEDRDGIIWFGTRDFGLYKYSPDGTCTQQEGLRSRAIRSVTQAPDGRIWVGTAHGLSMIDPESGHVANFTSTNGIGGNEFLTHSACVLPDGTVALGGNHGITTCHSVPLPDPSIQIPIVFESLKVDNQAVFPSENGIITDLMWNNPTVRLRYNQNNIAISFALLDYLPQERASFRFKLEGHDTGWTQIGDGTTVYFSRLRPGRYVLHVDADLAGEANVQESSLPIIVRPPFWGTLVAKLFYFAVLLSLAAVLIYFSRRRLKYELGLEQAAREKEHERELNRMSINFFGNLAHEFRAPLTLLEGPMAQLNASKDLSEQEHRLLDVMGVSVRRMHRLVNQIIDYNKIDTGSLSLLAVRDFDVAAKVRSIIYLSQVSAAARQISLSMQGLDKEAHLPLDEAKFESILSNLLSNAFKYASQEDGRVCVVLDACSAEELSKHSVLRQKDRTDRYITLAVENNGLPIDPDELEHVFDRYYQLREHGQNAKRVGSGIGLSFARTLADLHHGYLWAENLPDGAGVRFTLALPADVSPYAQDELSDTPAPEPQDWPQIKVDVSENGPANLNRATVMVIDDDIDIAGYLSLILNEDFKVQVCHSAGQALEIIQAEGDLPDIILSDIMMPGLDGIQMCRIIKSNPLTRMIPVMLITAKSEADFQVEGLESGADAYVTKPFDPTVLRAQIRSLLKNRFLSSGEVSDLLEVLHIDPSALSDGDRHFLSDIGNILQNNLDNTELDVNELARRLNISRSKLYYRVKDSTGMSPNDLMRNYRLEMAAQMLREGKSNVSEVAFAVGFVSLSYFSKSFKQHFGILPKDAARK